jgi:hypothetical protein
MASEHMVNDADRAHGKNPAAGDGVLQAVVRQLWQVSRLAPDDLLARVSAGDEALLPRYVTETADERSLVRSWESIERATPARLSPHQYQQFLAGESPTTAAAALDLHWYADRLLTSYLKESRLDLIFTALSVGLVILLSTVFFSFFSTQWLSMQWLQIAVGVMGGLLVIIGGIRTFTGWKFFSHGSQHIRSRHKSKWEAKTST